MEAYVLMNEYVNEDFVCMWSPCEHMFNMRSFDCMDSL